MAWPSKYISIVAVTPLDSSSAAPSRIPARTSSPVSFDSRGHITSCSHRSTGSPSPAPRSSTIGVWQWALMSPGIRIPSIRCTVVPG